MSVHVCVVCGIHRGSHFEIKKTALRNTRIPHKYYTQSVHTRAIPMQTDLPKAKQKFCFSFFHSKFTRNFHKNWIIFENSYKLSGKSVHNLFFTAWKKLIKNQCVCSNSSSSSLSVHIEEPIIQTQHTHIVARSLGNFRVSRRMSEWVCACVCRCVCVINRYMER